MNDLPLFLLGCLVSLIVFGAVGMLLWAVSNEPAMGESPESMTNRDAPRARRPQPSAAGNEQPVLVPVESENVPRSF